MRVRAAAAAALLLAITSLPTAVTTAAAAGTATAVPRVRDARITESSGLAPSLRHPGVLWTHNDSGNPPRLFALDPDGGTAATLRVSGTPDVDWEAIAALRTADGTAWLAIGDVGDNIASRGRVEIDLVREPARLADARARVAHRLLLRYPEGAADTETLLAHPRTGRLYLVTKTLLGARLYAVPGSAWPGTRARPPARMVRADLDRVAEVPVALATDGAFLPDGRIVLRNYSSVYVLPGPDGARDGVLQPLATLPAPQQQQGESLAVVDGGAAVLLGSEGRGERLLRVGLAAVPAATAAPAAAPETAAPPPTATPAPAAAPGSGGPPRALLVAAAALLALLAVLAVLVRHR